jgi:hypothetical protein
MAENMELTKESVEARGFAEGEYMGGKAYIRPIAQDTVLRFGGQFNGALELELPDGNDGFIILVPKVESWDDVEALARMFAGIWIDTGHTLSSNEEEASQEGPSQ